MILGSISEKNASPRAERTGREQQLMPKMTDTPTNGAARDNGKPNARQRLRLMRGVGRQIDAIYLQLDTQLTRMAHIQLQLDELRSRIRRL
jgi:hypothetical protein